MTDRERQHQTRAVSQFCDVSFLTASRLAKASKPPHPLVLLTSTSHRAGTLHVSVRSRRSVTAGDAIHTNPFARQRFTVSDSAAAAEEGTDMAVAVGIKERH